MKTLLAFLVCLALADPAIAQIRGEYDYYRMFVPKEGSFSARRHFGFARIAEDSSWLRSRAGGNMFRIIDAATRGDSAIIEMQGGNGARQQIRGIVRGDTIAGRLVRDTTTLSLAWLVRRKAPIAFEPPYSPWPGPLSQPTYQIKIDSAVAMKARDGTTLMSLVARPVGEGPFPVVMERTPYLRLNYGGAAQYWASRGYILVRQDVRGRGGSDGVYLHQPDQINDGYDAVEWAAQLPGSNGKVGLIGGSNPGEYAWYAAVAHPPHLAAIAPTVATGDGHILGVYIDMVFSIANNLPYSCMVQGREMHDLSNVDVGRPMLHLPVVELTRKLGCADQKYWDLWLEHNTLDAFWRNLSVESRLKAVTVPVLGMTGWFDDARGTIRQFARLDSLPGHPYQRLVVSAGAHKGIDYVYGDFGSQGRADFNAMTVRWFDRYLKGIDNGVDRGPRIDLFIMGANEWRQENEWPLARTQWTKFYLHSNGKLNTTLPGREPADTYVYDPADPTPFLIDGRELELNSNEDYTAVHKTRKDILLYETEPLTADMEITGPITASIWAITDARDTDWNVMLLDVHPDGTARRLVDGVMRARFRGGFDKPELLTPGKAYRYDIDMWWTGIVIPRGHKLRVAVASAAFPKYDRNLNTGGNNETETRFVQARQQILHDAAHPSFVTLPLIPRR
jgi:putative CocE/NonD family hydrolase